MEPSDLMFADHLDSPIAWREAGHGRPLVFLHGLGGTRKSWEPQLRGLADRFRCIAWDMPGYGASAIQIPLSYPVIVQRLVGLLDRLDIEVATLVGLSFGGMHALHTAISHPDRIEALVLADTSPAFGLDGTSPEDWKRGRLAPLEEGLTPGDLGSAVLDAIVGRPLDPGIRIELLEAFADISPAAFRAAVDCLPTNDVRAELASINHPTLVLVGELDTETPLSYAEVLARGLPNAELVVLPGVGHLAPSEDPAAFNAHVVRFLTDVG